MTLQNVLDEIDKIQKEKRAMKPIRVKIRVASDMKQLVWDVFSQDSNRVVVEWEKLVFKDRPMQYAIKELGDIRFQYVGEKDDGTVIGGMDKLITDVRASPDGAIFAKSQSAVDFTDQILKECL